jgi:hypothetical protein
MRRVYFTHQSIPIHTVVSIKSMLHVLIIYVTLCLGVLFILIKRSNICNVIYDNHTFYRICDFPSCTGEILRLLRVHILSYRA